MASETRTDRVLKALGGVGVEERIDSRYQKMN